MDVKRTHKVQNQKLKWIVFGVLSFGGVLIWETLMGGFEHTIKISSDKLLFASVKQGDLPITVEGFGEIFSSHKKLLTALSDATIEEILLKPGASVSKGSVLLRMSNPDLLQQAESAQQVLLQERANLRKLKIDQQRETLEEKSRLADLEANLNVARITLDAESVMYEKGIVSKMQFKQSEANKQKFEKQLNIQHDRLKQLTIVHKEAINIQLEIINQANGLYHVANHRIQSLTVKAGMAGVLQRLPVTLGQSVRAGEELALIGGTDKLEAQIRVPQSEAEKIQIGQTATIDTRSEKMNGTVYRIDPTVTEGTVLVEVALIPPLAVNARPGLNVDAVINIRHLENILYIQRPSNVQGHETTSLYKIIDQTQQAKLTSVVIGDPVGQYIEIISGASVDDVFILTDLSRYKQKDIIIQ